ncbi:uncharacterized protein LOC124896712 [Capsicum annuum]|uniref:uncharacterized protein LOC124896712 n=1 Tax=Capsicum annuum TaxID=4072 RepID=UPI001FB0B7ED|nr:uncharacterized protein LOC124896712 [Capsicum annuum]
MAKMMMQLNILTKHVMGAPTKMMNVVASKACDDEEAKKLDVEIRGSEKEPIVIDEKVDEDNEPRSDEFSNIQIPPLFLQRLKKKEESDKLNKFMAKLRNLSVNIPYLEVIQENLRYAKLMKKLMTKKKLIEGDTIEATDGCSAIMYSEIAEKKEDPKPFTIPCTIEIHMFEKDFYDLCESINLIPFVIYRRLGLGNPTPMSIRLLMEDRPIKNSVGILFDILVKGDRFILPAYFVVLNYEMGQEVPIVLSRPFLATERALVNLDLGK